MPKKLSETEVRKRLVRLTNLQRLYAQQSVVVTELRAENKQLKTELADFKTACAILVETQAARITELETMVFGRKKRPRSGSGKDSGNKEPKTPRDPD